MLSTLARDLRYALRGLRRTPIFAITALVTLALGIGATTAAFSLFYGLFLRPLPYAGGDQLMRLYLTNSGMPGRAANERFPWSYPKYEAARAALGLDAAQGEAQPGETTFTRLAPFAFADLTLTGGGGAERVAGELIGADYLETLGVEPQLGRGFLPEDDARPDGRPVALLGHQLWQRRFAGDRAVIGETIEINLASYQVVGVLPEGFHGLAGGPGAAAEVWLPFVAGTRALFGDSLDQPWGHWLDVVARRAPGVGEAAAAERMRAVGGAVSEAYPSPRSSGATWGAAAAPLAEAERDPEMRAALGLLLAGVGCVLLIACVNLANLMLARAASRRREVAVRRALGAGGGDLVRLALTESLLLSFSGAAAGVAAAFLVLQLLRNAAGPVMRQVASGVSLDGTVLAFAAALALATGLLFGSAPAIHGLSGKLTAALRDGAAGSGGGRGGAALARQLLVAAQVALAVVLLAAAGLLLKSFLELNAVDPGYDTEGVLAFSLDPPDVAAALGDAEGSPAAEYGRRLLERITALPGVASATLDGAGPLSGRRAITVVTSLDGAEVASGEGGEIGVHRVAPEHFATLGIGLRAGRAFTAADREGAPLVAIVSQQAAERLWPGRSAVGRRIGAGVGGFSEGNGAEVVGVAADVRYDGLDQPPGMEIYLPHAQAASPRGTVYVRAAGGARGTATLFGALREAVAEVDPNLPVYDLATLDALAGRDTAAQRWGAYLLLAFAAFALLLAAVGVYGVTSYAVAQRRREIGVRMALGAGRGSLVGLFLRRGAVLAAAGLAIGLGAALAIQRLLQGVLYGVEPDDPAVLTVISLLLAATAMFAVWLPARKAAAVDPATVLRSE